MRVLGVCFALLFAGQTVLAAECDPAKATSTVSFKEKIQPFFSSICVACHNSMEAPEGLVLETEVSHDLLVDTRSVQSSLKRIEPGKPEESYMLHKLRGTHETAGGSGNQMPSGMPPLNEAEIGLIVQWITDCSPNN